MANGITEEQRLSAIQTIKAELAKRQGGQTKEPAPLNRLIGQLPERIGQGLQSIIKAAPRVILEGKLPAEGSAIDAQLKQAKIEALNKAGAGGITLSGEPTLKFPTAPSKVAPVDVVADAASKVQAGAGGTADATQVDPGREARISSIMESDKAVTRKEAEEIDSFAEILRARVKTQ